MRSINKVILIGNVGNPPEVNTLEGNILVAKLSLATTESYRDKNGQQQTDTDWHTVVLWRGLAELVQKYVNKGSLLYIEGKLKTRFWEDKEGYKRYVTEVIADQLVMLDKKTN